MKTKRRARAKKPDRPLHTKKPTKAELAMQYAALALGYRALAKNMDPANRMYCHFMAEEARAQAATLGCNIVFKQDEEGT